LIRLPTLTAAALALAIATGCSVDDEQLELQRYVLDTPPAGIRPAHLDFGGKCTLEAFRIEPADVVRPGQMVDLVLYWRSRELFDEAYWYVFTHVVALDGAMVLNVSDLGPLRARVVTPPALARRIGVPGGVIRQQMLGPPDWMPGKVYEDWLRFTLPEKLAVPEIAIVAGIWNGATRLPVAGGHTLGQNAGLVVRMAVDRNRPSRESTALVP
jgi:hypothetical protein